MFIKKSYKNAQTARVALQAKLNEIGLKLSDVEYEIKSIRNSGRFHPVVSAKNGRIVRVQCDRSGFIVA